MSLLRNKFKQIAAENEKKCLYLMESEFNDIWQIIERCNGRIDICLDAATNQSKETVFIVMLRNIQSDLLCCIDSLERGHGQTVENNLRMAFETFCLVYHMYNDKTDKTWQEYKKGKHSTPDSITYCKNHCIDYSKFGHLYGLLSNISHQSRIENVARNIDRSGILYHLKPFVYNDYKQCLVAFILFLFYKTTQLAEEIVIANLSKPYFWEKMNQKWQEKTELPEYVLIQKIVKKLQNSSYFTFPV